MVDRSIIDLRRDQMFPVLEISAIDQIRHYGVVRTFSAGEPLLQAGEIGRGLNFILSRYRDEKPAFRRSTLS
jgi:thioredoxin reductase (NADPH)